MSLTLKNKSVTFVLQVADTGFPRNHLKFFQVNQSKKNGNNNNNITKNNKNLPLGKFLIIIIIKKSAKTIVSPKGVWGSLIRVKIDRRYVVH